MKYLALFVLLISNFSYAQASQMFIDAGLGVFSSKGPSLSENKFAKIGYEEDVWYTLKQRLNIGGWLDTRGTGYSSGVFAGYQLGFEVTNNSLEGSVWFGPSLISNTDSVLGGNFQFNTSVFFGIKDNEDNTIGAIYNHLSSAGIYTVNKGRDFLGLEIKF